MAKELIELFRRDSGEDWIVVDHLNDEVSVSIYRDIDGTSTYYDLQNDDVAALAEALTQFLQKSKQST